MTVRLVTFEEPVWSTIQGEGILVGTPSAFVRFYGCDFSCSWCDTKGSWKPGSTYVERDVVEIVGRARSFKVHHAVVTGGNPVLQERLPELIVGLQEQWRSEGDWYPGMFVTVETQGSVYDDAVAYHADLMSLSPKLHDWRDEPLREYLKVAMENQDKLAQVKIVCGGNGDTEAAILRINMLYEWAKRFGDPRGVVHFILQPESSLGREGVQTVIKNLSKVISDRRPGVDYPIIRVVPQLHKLAYHVR